jgi:spore germination protein GerM
VIILLAGLLASCGVATDDRAVPIDLGDQPPGLVPTSTSTTLSVPDSEEIAVYFFDPEPEIERLVDESRQAAPGVTVRSVVDALLAGTTEDEKENGLRSEIPEGTALLGHQRRATNNVLVLNFNETFVELEGDAQSRAFAQIVYTVDDLEPGARIEFRVDGQPRGALTDTGETASRCVTVDDYPTLHPDHDPENPPAPVPPPTDCDIETVEG